MPEALVEASGLSRTFGRPPAETTAIREATFEVRPGDRIRVVGPSGSGKSTLLYLIAALDQPTSGTIRWPALGPPSGLRPDLVAVSFQGPSLLPALSVEENVALPLLLGGTDEGEGRRAASEMLDR